MKGGKMNTGWKVCLRYDPQFRGVNLWMLGDNKDGTMDIVNPMAMVVTTVNWNERLPEPTLQFRGDNALSFLQSLAEGLAESGFHPKEIEASNKQIEALKNHLEDMRRLVFKEWFPPTNAEEGNATHS